MKKLFQNKSLSKSIRIFLVCLVVLLLPESPAYADTWTAKSSMPTMRALLTAATVNNKIYAIGGGSGGALSTVEEYDSATDTWTAKSSMPTGGRWGLAAATVNNKIYAIGGYSGGFFTTLDTVEEYDPATDTWTTKSSMPTVRSELAAVTVNNKIYAIGGGGGGALSTVEEYDPATDTWTAKSSMPTARRELAAAVVDNKIYVIGGLGGLDTVEEYDPATDTWTAKSSMLTGRWGLVAATVNNKIYAIGGNGGLDTVEEYNPATDTWIARPSIPMPTARYGLAAATVNNKIYAIGGFGGTGKETEELFITIPLPSCSITGSYPLATWIPHSDTYSYSRTNENVSIEYVGGESYNITDGDVTILYREPDESSVDCNTNACGFLTLVKENNAPGDYYFLIGEDDFMPGGSAVCNDCSNDVCQAFKNDFIPIISANLIGGTISYSAISRFGGLLGYSVITADNGVDKIHFIFADFMRTGFLATKGWNSVDIAGELLSGSFTESVDMCSIFPSVPICTLTANPTSIIAGGFTKLTWSSTNATAVNSSNFGAGPVETENSVGIFPSPAATITYTLTVANAAGVTDTCTADVIVTVPIPPTPPSGIPDMGHSTDHGNYFKYDKDIVLVFTEGAEFLLKIIGGLALFILILGGVYYITSGANPDGQTKAKKTVTYAIIGLAIALVSYVIIMVAESIGV